MSALPEQFSVVFRSDLRERDRELLEQFCGEIAGGPGPDLLHFRCTSISLAHHFYIEMETFKPGDSQTHPVRVPHHFVFLISGSDSKASIGFTRDYS
jgi:hypothetical protein